MEMPFRTLVILIILIVIFAVALILYHMVHGYSESSIQNTSNIIDTALGG